MIHVRKVLFCKILAISVSICVFVNTMGHAAPGLRVPLMHGKMGNNQNSEREAIVIEEVQYSIAYNNEVKEKIKATLKGLRPDFEDKEKLSTTEIDMYFGQKSKEFGIDYKHVKAYGLNNPIISLKHMFDAIISLDFPFLMLSTVSLWMLSFAATTSIGGDVEDGLKIRIVTTGIFASFVPFVLWILMQFGIVKEYWFFDSVKALLSTGFNLLFYALSGRFFIHEIKHAYPQLYYLKLQKEGVIKADISVGEFNDLLGFEHDLSLLDPLQHKYIKKDDFIELEDRVIKLIVENPDALSDDFKSKLSSNKTIGSQYSLDASLALENNVVSEKDETKTRTKILTDVLSNRFKKLLPFL